MANIEKMYTYLRGYFVGANMKESLVALQFAREYHANQTRKDGTPYVGHPLSMAYYAVALGLRNDDTIATILLHDVVEDCGVQVEYLPVNGNIKNAVRYMTIQKFETDASKIETKCRYFNELLECPEALICKAIDRYNNLSDMAFNLSADAVGKNCAETDELLLPVLREAKEKYPDLADILFILRTNIATLNNVLKYHYLEEYEKWIKIYQRGK